MPWQTSSQTRLCCLPPPLEPQKKEKKSPGAVTPSPFPEAALPLCTQRLDHRREEPSILGGDLRDILRATDVGVLHRLGEGSTSRAVAQGAGEVAAVARRHGSSRPLCPRDRHGDLQERHRSESPVPWTTQPGCRSPLCHPPPAPRAASAPGPQQPRVLLDFCPL